MGKKYAYGLNSLCFGGDWYLHVKKVLVDVDGVLPRDGLLGRLDHCYWFISGIEVSFF